MEKKLNVAMYYTFPQGEVLPEKLGADCGKPFKPVTCTYFRPKFVIFPTLFQTGPKCYTYIFRSNPSKNITHSYQAFSVQDQSASTIRHPIPDQNGSKTILVVAAHPYVAYTFLLLLYSNDLFHRIYSYT